MQKELIVLLLSADSGEYERMDGNVKEFNERFQSFLDQMPKSTGSSSAPGQESFFRGQFLGMFAGMKNTEIYHDLGIQDISFKFGHLGNLHVVVKQKGEQKIFIFTGDMDKKFYGDCKSIYTGDICIIDVSKKQGRLKMHLMGSPFNQNYVAPSDFVKMPEVQGNNKGKAYKKLKDYIAVILRGTQRLRLSAVNAFFEYNIDLYREIKNCLKGQRGILDIEAFQHGFLTGILMNFRFQDNLKPNIELISGKGYVDMFLLIRGEERSQFTMPIIIELKNSAGLDPVRRASNEAKWYANGLYSNKMRVITNSKYVFCIGLVLNGEGGVLSSVQEIKVRNKPFLEDLLNLVSEKATEKVRALLREVHYSFPSTEYSYDYLSRFILGQSLILDGVNGEMIIRKGVFKHSDLPHLTSLAFQMRDKLLIVHLDSQERYIDHHSNTKIPIPIDGTVKRVLEIKINEYNTQLHKSPGEYFSEGGTVKILDSVSLEGYKERTYASGHFYLINQSSAANLKNRFNVAVDYQHNQLGTLIEERNPVVATKDAVEMGAYKELYSTISKELFQIINANFGRYEYRFKACLDGILTGLSDIRYSRDGLTVMVPTEFQVGMGKRADIATQTVDKKGKYGTPVFIELKSDISGKQFIDAHDQIGSCLEAPGVKGLTDGSVSAGFVLALNSRASSGSDLIKISDKFIVAPVFHSSITGPAIPSSSVGSSIGVSRLGRSHGR